MALAGCIEESTPVREVGEGGADRGADGGVVDGFGRDQDAAATDAGSPSTDPGLTDLGPSDLGPSDLGPSDLGPSDVGPTDTGGPVTGDFVFGLQVSNDVAASVYVQLMRADGQVPAWLSVTRLGSTVPLQLFDDPCGLPACGSGEPQPSCEPPFDLVRDVTLGGLEGEHTQRWDRLLRVRDPGADCVRLAAAEEGAYVATICYGLQLVDGRFEPVDASSQQGLGLGRVLQSVCTEAPFKLPLDSQAFAYLFGG